MLGDILEINNNYLKVSNNINTNTGLINMYAKAVDNEKIYIGEIININKNTFDLKLIGEFINNKFVFGLTKKPALTSKISLLNNDEIKILFGINDYKPNNSLYLGKSALYQDYPIYLTIDKLFASHLVILGNTGSGKSCGSQDYFKIYFIKKMLAL